MRTEFFLSILAILMSFFTGMLALSLKNDSFLGFSVPILQNEILKFKKENKKIDSVRTDGILNNLNPENILPFYYYFDFKEVLQLEEFRKTCKISNFKKSK